MLASNRLAATLTVAAALAVLASQPALAGRPLQTEDAGVLEAKACEVEGVWGRAKASGLPSARETSLQFGCGWGYNSQLALAVARASSGGAHANGARLGGKTQLWSNEAKEPTVFTLAYGLTAADVPGSGWKHAATDINAVLSTPVAGMTLHANLGWSRDQLASSSATSWGVALEHPGFGSVAPMAELFGDEDNAPWWNLGLRWTVVPDKTYLDLSYGRQMITGRPSMLTVGFKFAF